MFNLFQMIQGVNNDHGGLRTLYHRDRCMKTFLVVNDKGRSARSGNSDTSTIFSDGNSGR